MTETRQRKRLSKGFMSYLKFFLMLSLSVVVLFGSMQYVLSYNSMQETALENTRSSLLLLANTHEMILSQVDRSILALSDQTMLSDYMDYFYNNQHNMCLSMIKQLYSIAQGNSYIHSICIYYPQEQYTISSDFGPATIGWYHDEAFIRTLPEYSNIKTRVFRRELNSSIAQKQNVLTVVRHIPAFIASGTPKAYVVVNLDSQAIAESLMLLSDATDIRLLVMDKQGNAIAETGVDTEQIALFAELAAEAGTLKDHRVRLGGEELLVQSMQTERGWTYYLARPTNVMMGSISRMQNSLLSVCALVLLVSVVMSLYLSRRAYEPIQEISKRFEGAFGNEEIYARRELQSIINRADSIIARNKQLEGEWRKSVRKNRELCFWNLVQQEPSANLQPEDMLLSLGIGPSAHPKRLLVARDLGAMPEKALESWNSLIARLELQVTALFFPKGEYTVMIFECLNDAAFAAQKDLLSSFLRTLGSTAVAISEPIDSAERLREAWQTQSRQCGLSMEESNEATLWEIPIENDLLRALKNRDMKAVRAALDTFLLHLIRMNASGKTVRRAYRKIYDLVSQLVDDVSDNPFPEGETKASVLDRSIESLCLATVERLAPTQSTFYSTMIRDVCAYVDANLSDDLSIDRLAERFHLSATSLRKVFRSEVGMTPKEYVDGRRALAAKQMLSEQDLQIQEIANQLGFQYSQSFIAFFRSVEGVTPGEYRAMTKNDQE